MNIIQKEAEGYTLFIKNDGTDYEKLWHDFRDGRIENQTILKDNGRSRVSFAEIKGRIFLFKIDYRTPETFENKLWYFIRGPVHSRQMRRVNRAVNAGCNTVQDIYFVAEKQERICSEAYIILDYFPGHAVKKEPVPAARADEVGRVIAGLHRYDLAHGDINWDNFIITTDGIKAIDLSWKSSVWVGKGWDILRAKSGYGITVPVNNFSEQLAVCFVRLKYAPRNIIRRVKKFFAGKKR